MRNSLVQQKERSTMAKEENKQRDETNDQSATGRHQSPAIRSTVISAAIRLKKAYRRSLDYLKDR